MRFVVEADTVAELRAALRALLHTPTDAIRDSEDVGPYVRKTLGRAGFSSWASVAQAGKRVKVIDGIGVNALAQIQQALSARGLTS